MLTGVGHCMDFWYRFRFVRCKPVLHQRNRAIRSGIGYRGILNKKKALDVSSALIGAERSDRGKSPN
jgi:hypothetical protein